MDQARKIKLGQKWACFSCGGKFYDLGKPEPICPKCGQDQRDSPIIEPPKRRKTAAKPKAKPKAKAKPKPKAKPKAKAKAESPESADEADLDVDVNADDDDLTLAGDDDDVETDGKSLV